MQRAQPPDATDGADERQLAYLRTPFRKEIDFADEALAGAPSQRLALSLICASLSRQLSSDTRTQHDGLAG